MNTHQALSIQNTTASIPQADSKSLTNASSTAAALTSTQSERRNCVLCGHRLSDQTPLTTFPCNLRAFSDQVFNVWRCPDCQTIHCLEVVDLDYYYAQYPDEELTLNVPMRLIYSGLHKRLKKHGFTPKHKLLDYGCGRGLFLQYLKENGFEHGYGYDPYGEPDGLGSAETLSQGPFDYILLSDVIEHVEDPRELLQKLDTLLAPCGRIMIGAPNADNLDLNQPQRSDYYNEIHVPYHLHIYTRKGIEQLGKAQGWTPIGFFNRAYYDSPWIGLNARAWNVYQRMGDGTINVVAGDPIRWKWALRSPKFWFYAIFGYWLGFRTGMDIVFEKGALQQK